MDSNVVISRLQVEDWKTYRKIRLESLKDSPDAFGSTWQREVGFSDSQWQERLATTGREQYHLPLIACCESIPCGLASGLAHEPDLNEAHIYQMWVNPKYRGNKIGRGLLDEIILWANKV